MVEIKKQNSVNSLYGLVLAGGKSTRMKIDKSILHYHGKTQVEHGFELLQKYCAKVFISNREEQAQLQGHDVAPQIHDQPQFNNLGPISGTRTSLQKSMFD